jgi:hypothetical protein
VKHPRSSSRILAAILAGFVPVAVTRAQTDAEAAREAVREFRRFYRTFNELPQKVEAVYTLKGQESAEAAQELVALLDARELEIRDAAMDVLTSYRQTETFQGMIDALPGIKKPEQQAALIEVLGRAKIQAALPAFEAVALQDRRASVQVKHAVARALGVLGAVEPAAPILRALLGDSEQIVRMAAADAVGVLRLQSVGPALVPLLDDRAWQVRSAAIGAAGKVRVAEAVEPLIKLMRQGGRLEEECAEALYSITLLDFGTQADVWEKQWNALQGIGWRIPTDQEVAKARESRKRSDAYYGRKEETTTFGGITTTSRRILFIIDVSGSMDDLVVERSRFDAGYADFKKLTIVKTELRRTIEALDTNTMFNIVAFATDTDTWKKFLVPANIVNKASAQRWVEKLQAIGGSEAQELAAAGLAGSANLEAGKTNTFKALMHPFGIDPAKPPPVWTEKAAFKNELDTVFFLSDGRPSTGKLVDTVEILKEVRRYNETFKIVFHTIAIGEFEKHFLRGLAEANGGTFVDLGR